MVTVNYILYAMGGVCLLLAAVNLVLTVVRFIKYEINGENIDIDATPMLRSTRSVALSVALILIGVFHENGSLSPIALDLATIVIAIAIVVEIQGWRDRRDVLERGFRIRKPF